MARCLVLGSALCLWNDVERALDISEFEAVVACKRAAVLWPGALAAFVTLHPETIQRDLKDRRLRGYPTPERVYAHSQPKGITHVLDYKFGTQKASGSSGLFAVKVALELGYSKLVLCGIPMDAQFGKLDAGPLWNGRDVYRKGFEEAIPCFEDRVRSMSGWTESKLSAPTVQWLGA